MEQKIKLSIEEIYSRMQDNDPDITKGVPSIFKSPIWSKYRCIFYKGTRQDFAQCKYRQYIAISTVILLFYE